MLDEKQILQIINAELTAGSGGDYDDYIAINRKNAMSYYLGNPNGYEVEGRSEITSTDVADAIEWLMPEVMAQMCRNEVVTFDPMFEGDERQAELETQVTYDCIMKDNPGFVLLHTFTKDALLQKNGISKTIFHEERQETVERMTSVPLDALAVLLSDPQVDLMEKSEYVDQQAKQQQDMMYQQMVMQAQQNGQPPPPPPPEPMLADVKFKRTYKKRKVEIKAIAPEDFRIRRQHNCADPTQSPFCADVQLVTASDLVREGIKKDKVAEYPDATTAGDDDRDYRFTMSGETVYPNRDVSEDDSMRHIEVLDCFMHIDIDEDGIAEFMRIRCAGGDNPTNIISMEPFSVDDHPYGAFLAIMMSHKFYGLSIYDRLREIQLQKTTLLRNIFDNLYLQNNQRTAVLQGQVNLDDLLLSRPGGVVRQNVPGAIEPIVTPPIGDQAYQMMDYLDQVRSGRVGVHPEGQIQVDNIGDRVGSEGIERLMTSREALAGLIVRTIAETGFKPLMCKVRNLLRKHSDTLLNVKFKDQWLQVNPADWKAREHTTVRVGTGSGNDAKQAQAMMAIMEDQMVLKQDPGQTLVNAETQFNARRTFCNVSGLSSASAYYLDPGSQQGQMAQKQTQQMREEAKMKEDEERAAQLDMQAKISAAELGKSEAQQKNVMLEAQLDNMKIELEAAQSMLNQQTEDKKLELQEKEMNMNAALKLTEIESREKVDIKKAQVTSNKEAVNG